MKLQTITIYLIVAFLFFGCKGDKKNTQNTDSLLAGSITIKAVRQAPSSSDSTKIQQSEPVFPATGNTINDFIPAAYEIDMETAGDLNHDGLEDKVVILLNTKDTTDLRATLILLKQENVYNLYATSFSAIDPKFREDGYLNYDYEDIKIDKNGQLVITQQATGPNGNLESMYQFINNELILTHIRTFNMGAGGQTELQFDLLKGIFEQTDINTMKEDMPSETYTKKHKLPKITFEESDPQEIITEASKVNGQ